MVHAIRLHAPGGPEALRWEAIDVRRPAPGEVRIASSAIGLNYIDVYHRSGLYKLAALPAVIGMEGAGDVVAVGAGVSRSQDRRPRRRMRACSAATREERLIAADRLVKLPDAIGYETAAAMMLQGMTVRYLFRETYRVPPGNGDAVSRRGGRRRPHRLPMGESARRDADRHGGLGREGAHSRASRAAACHQLQREDFVARVREITEGEGCDVVYDSIGKDTFPASLDCLKPQGALGELRQRLGPGAAVRAHGAQGLALRHAAVAHGLYARVDAALSRQCGRACSTWSRRGLIKIERQSDVSAEPSRRRASRSRSAQDDGLDVCSFP